jgi:N-hydroxyarylamine O-acetyltransferase
MEVSAYLDRISYPGPVRADAETLRGLHRAHMLAVPFENLDIFALQRPIALDEPALWYKIMVSRRGGFCYELNGLFAALLREVGFEVTYLNGRVFGEDGRLGIDFDHLALLVRAPGEPVRWLADVGFGNSFSEPLNLEERANQEQHQRAYRLEATQGGYAVSQRDYEGSWSRLYWFDLQPRTYPADFQAGCRYHQTSPQSSFTRGNIISRATPDGRISLQDGRLIVTNFGIREERELAKGEYPALLREHFGVILAG